MVVGLIRSVIYASYSGAFNLMGAEIRRDKFNDLTWDFHPAEDLVQTKTVTP